MPLVSKTVQRSVARKEAKGARAAAVLVPLCEIGGELSCVFSVRSSQVSTHKSQVSFPGGHRESGETAVEAALRETSEEFGRAFSRGFVAVDTCAPVLAITGTVVTSVVGCRSEPLDDLAAVAADVSEAEVSEVFALPLTHLLDDAHREVRDYPQRGRLPVFHGGPEEIWGLTAYILDGVLQKLVRPCWDLPCRGEEDTAMFP